MAGERHDRRDGGVSAGDGSELLAIADRVVAQAAPGEQLEAFVSRGGDTEVRVYQGEVEHRDFVLGRKEREHKVILCCSRAKEAGGEIVVDL